MSRPRTNSSLTVILDNGASTIKCGVLGSDNEPRLVTNAVLRSKRKKTTFIGPEIDTSGETYSGAHYRLPCEKGFVVDWDAQKAIWDRVFSTSFLNIDTTQSRLVLTEPYFNLPNIQETYDQIVFEEYQFEACYRCSPASLIPCGTLFDSMPSPECMVIVDSGFSFTHVVPMIRGQIVWKAVIRIDVGGKLLTNHLKETLSARQMDVMDETSIINHVKETSCFVSTDFNADLESTILNRSQNQIYQEYIMPDISQKQALGHLRVVGTEQDTPPDKILKMNNERFSIPELLFKPTDIGLDQSGIAESVALSISRLPKDIQGMFWANIGLIGGSTKFPGFKERLTREIRSLAPSESYLRIFECNDPVIEAYKSAYSFVNTSAPSIPWITRAEYEESGSNRSAVTT